MSPTQSKVLRAVAKAPNQHRRFAGHGMAPYLSAARALVRKGKLSASHKNSYFFLTDEQYKNVLAEGQDNGETNGN